MTKTSQPEHKPAVSASRATRVVYVGMLGDFSYAPLAALLAAGIDIAGVLVPAAPVPAAAPIAPLTPPQRSSLPIANPYLARNILHIAWEHGIPTFAIGRPSAPETLAAVADLRPDVACVVCFPQRIPAALLGLPPLGFLNLHPSLLPAYRGPAPLFWAFRNGERATGVTVHFMDEGLDSGGIVAQAPVELPDGVSGAQADRMCSALGARLLVETVQSLQRGTLSRCRQPTGGAYYPWPAADDFTISTTWPARRVFNFMRGTAEWGQPYVVEAGGEPIVLRSALGYAADEILGTPYVRSPREISIQCTPGVVRARE